MSKMISRQEATKQVQLMARRTAMLYHHMAAVLSEHFGEEKAAALLKEAIWRYGTECGEQVRKQVLDMGLPLTLENYNKAEDLPSLGWEITTHKSDNKEYPQVNHCPLAPTWIEKGNQKMGRIYCYVDQAKYQSYNGSKCVHLKNLLDGDECCLFDFEEPATDQ